MAAETAALAAAPAAALAAAPAADPWIHGSISFITSTGRQRRTIGC